MLYQNKKLNIEEINQHQFLIFEIYKLTVCILAMRMCELLKATGISVDKKAVIQAALCHDLAMVGREERYKNRSDSWRSHPKDSVSVARELVPDLEPNTESMIESHMWPIAGPAPRSKEAVILNLADKWASAADWVFFITGKKTGVAIRKKLDNENEET